MHKQYSEEKQGLRSLTRRWPRIGPSLAESWLIEPQFGVGYFGVQSTSGDGFQPSPPLNGSFLSRSFLQTSERLKNTSRLFFFFGRGGTAVIGDAYIK